MAQFLEAAIKTLSAGMQQREIYGHLGWRQIDERWLYLHAGGAVGADGAVEGVSIEIDGELARFELPAPPDDPRGAIRAALGLFDLDPMVAAAVWRAPLAEWCPVVFSVFIAGRTGILKNAVAGVAQAHWGPHWDGVRFSRQLARHRQRDREDGVPSGSNLTLGTRV
jgi:hypothetical protein